MHFLRHLLPIILLAAGLTVRNAAADLELAIPLVENGKSDFAVVIRPKPDEKADLRAWNDERAAADDFVRLLEKMTGVKLAIVTEVEAGKLPVYIGETAKELVPDYKDLLKHPDPLALVNDRLLIAADLGGIAVVGGRPWATRLAVTQFFEDLGCRWYGGGEFFEVVPKKKTVKVEAGRKIVTPDFEMRDVWHMRDIDRAHLKLTRHDDVLNHGHSWHHWIGKERKADPALRGVVQGERKGKLCFSNPEVVDIFARNINTWIEKRGQKTVSLSTDDGPVYCRCAECEKWAITERANPFMATPSISDAVLRLYNKIIPKVLDKHPNTVFGFLVYANTMTPPRYEKVHPQIAIVGAPLAENAMVPTTSVTDKRRTHFRECLETWMKIARRGYIYEYDPFVIWHGIMCPRVELIRRNVPYYKSIGIRGMNIESRKSQFAESGLNILVYSRLFWDTKADVSAILEDYATTFYGPAARPVREWIGVTQRAMLYPDAPIFGNEDINIEHVYTPEVMHKAEEQLAKAEKLATEEPWKTRVSVLRMIHDHTAAYLSAKRLMDEGKYAESLDSFQKMEDLKTRMHEIEPTLADPKRWDIARKSPPWINGLRKQVAHWASLAGQTGKDSAGALVTMLPQEWAFTHDPENLGINNGWQKGELPNAKPIKIAVPWDYQGFTDLTANGWYQTTVTVPKKFEGKPVRLYFTRVFGMKIDVWLDDQLVEHRELPRYFWYNYHHEQEFDLTPHVKAGTPQRITVRIFKEFDWGGPYGSAFLYSPKDPKKPLEGKK